MPAFLIAEDGPQTGLVISFEDSDEWTIGRDPEQADILVEDTSVSRQHLHCYQGPEGIYISNLSTTNPTLVNDEPIVGEHLLREGDHVKIGQSVFRFTEQLPSDANPPLRPKPASEETAKAFDSIFEDIEEPTEQPAEEPIEEESEEEIKHVKKRKKKRPPKPDRKADEAYDTIFDDSMIEEELPFNLISEANLILKVVAGPNAGAEIGIEKSRSYVIGKDPNSCDIVFQDLSVSRNHARLIVDSDGKMSIEDLDSKNGTLLNNTRITAPSNLTSQDLVSLGTTTFMIIDREAAEETIVSPIPTFEAREPAKEEEEEEEEKVQAAAKAKQKVPFDWRKQIIPINHLVLAGSVVVILFIVFLSFFGLFKAQRMEFTEKNPNDQIKDALEKYKDVRYSYNPAGGKLFLVGHVMRTVDESELMYNIEQLPFVTDVENNVIIDELVWKNMNDVITETSAWKGVSIYSPKAGTFVARGYVQQPQDAENLADYLNVNFPYNDRLENHVVIETNLNQQIQNLLLQNNFEGVTFQITNGELVLAGRYSEKRDNDFENLLKLFSKVPGVREVKNLSIPSNPQTAAIDISDQYRVTGYSQHDHKNYSVVLNGKIVTIGQMIGGMKITNILSETILLEKDGLKYKINYSQ